MSSTSESPKQDPNEINEEINEELDAIVIGAGLSGLAAAVRLQAAGKRVRVLEARERVGGRTLTVDFHGGPVDLGGQWVGPTQTRVLSLVDELGLELVPQFHAGSRLVDFDGSVRRYRGLLPKIPLFALGELGLSMVRLDRMAARVPREAPWQAAEAARWDAMTVDEWLTAHVRTPGARAMLRIATEAIFAAHPRELSFLFFLHYLHCGGGIQRLAEIEDGAQQWKIDGGAQRISLGLSARLGPAISFDEPVRAIEQDQQGVTVIGTRQRYRAARAILAVSPAIAASIELPPTLSASRQALHERMFMGSTIKCLVAYEQAFWRARGLSGEAVSDRLRVRLAFDASSADGRLPRLVAFVFDEDARTLGQLDADARRQAILDDLAQLFGPEASSPSAYVEHDWRADPYSSGCYTGLLGPGAFAQIGPALREVAGRLHFAGTEAARRWVGYFEGAIESGERAAEEVIEALSCVTAS
ncbi:MAG: NAD(P)/FAD-dependent oxidoreductase [Enhygromyxa sp.]